MATEKISTSIIADDAVSTDQIANNASISTSGNIATTGSGTLTSAGAFTASGGIANAGTITAGTLGSSVVVPASIGASLVLLNTTTISSPVGDVQFNNTLITTTYNYYVVVMQGLSASADNFDFFAYLSNDNGSSGATVYSSAQHHRINGSSAEGRTQQSNHKLFVDGEGVADPVVPSGGSSVFELIIAPGLAEVDAYTRSWGAVKNQNGDFYGYTTTGIVGTQSNSARINHLKFDEANGSNIDAGKFSLYAYKL